MVGACRMGTHPSGPSKTMGNDTLKEWVEANPDCLGKLGLERFGVELPFLFKVCMASLDCIRSLELSLQLHNYGLDALKKLLCPLLMGYGMAAQVLSVETALSIQSHPDKKLAEKLHRERPHVR